MRSTRFAFNFCLALLAASSASAADSRYGCMADDAAVKLGIHVEFSDELGGRLSHLSAKIGLLGADAPEGLRQIKLRSPSVAQAWSGNGKLMMRFYDEDVPGRPLTVAISATAGEKDAVHLRGTYTLDQAQEKGPGFHAEGALFCQVDGATGAAPGL